MSLKQFMSPPQNISWTKAARELLSLVDGREFLGKNGEAINIPMPDFTAPSVGDIIEYDAIYNVVSVVWNTHLNNVKVVLHEAK